MPPTKKIAKRVAKKVAKKSGARVVAVKVKAKVERQKATPTRQRGKGIDFAPGSDLAVVWEEILKGGSSRREVLARIHERFKGATTRGGNPKPAATIMNQVIARALDAGYTVEESWRLVPPSGDAAPFAPATEETSTVVKKPRVAKKAAKKVKTIRKR